MLRGTLTTCVVLAAALTGAGARAQQIPATEPGPAIVTTRMVDGAVEMRDASNNAPLIMPRGVMPHKVRPGGDSLSPEVEMRPQPTGYDIVYRFHNTSTRARRLGAFDVGVMTLGANVTYHDFRWDGKPKTASTTNPIAYNTWMYPMYMYSPVAVVRNGTYAIGVSLHYPLLEYKHNVRFEINTPGGAASIGEGGRGWCVNMRFQNYGDEVVPHGVGREAWMQPGEERTYVVSVRVTKTPGEWIRTLVPYREYFNSLYGGVRYTRDVRPVIGYTLAGTWMLSPTNPLGFTREDWRPDLHGWGPISANLASQAGDWSRAMIWTPTGLYRNNLQLNYPFQFTTPWLSTGGVHGTRMSDAVEKFGAVAAQGNIEFGFWWGRSAQVMTVWDSSYWAAFDPDNSLHVAAALAELDLAVETGATMIGLDAFYTFSPLEDMYRWMQMMLARHPHLKFVTEGRNPDVMHTLAPTWMEFYDSPRPGLSVEQCKQVVSPFYLADLLLPGHETWGGLAFNRLRDTLGRPLTAGEIRAEVERAAALGYVPAVFDSTPVGPNGNAVPSWEQTVPADLRSGAVGDPVSDPHTPPPAPPSGADNGGSVAPPPPVPPPGADGPRIIRSSPKTFIKKRDIRRRQDGGG